MPFGCRSTNKDSTGFPGIQSLTFNLKFNIYPNASGSTFAMRYKSGISGIIQIQLFDNRGNLIRQIYQGFVKKGSEGNYYLSKGYLAAGILYNKIKIRNRNKSAKNFNRVIEIMKK
ncbi:MAG: hypothetical protein ABIU11_03865 [Chitinophagaceae bacterium]